MTLIPGKQYKFIVKKETDIAYMLENEQDINNLYFLHFNECDKKKLEVGQEIKAYLFLDNKNREALTLLKPIIQNEEKAYLEVATKVDNLGIFLKNNIQKDLLLSKEQLPLDEKKWPQVGDIVFVEQYYKKRLLAKLSIPNPNLNNNLEIDTKIKARILNIGPAGFNLSTKENDLIFIHNSQVKENNSYRIGQEVDVIITNKNLKNGYNARFDISYLEETIKDADIIINYLNTHYGVLKLDASSSSEDIKIIFKNLSRKQFKKALGYLYKKRLIKFENNMTLKKD